MENQSKTGKFISRQTAKLMANLKRVRIILMIGAVLGVASMCFAIHAAMERAKPEENAGNQQSFSQSEPITQGDFTYRRYLNGYALIDYNGESSKVEVPAIVNGSPVLRIEENAFADSIYIVSISISANTESIGMDAFKGCTSLMNVELPDSLSAVGSNAFYGCTMLRSLKLPAYLTEISPSAFRCCADDFMLYVEEGSYSESYAKSYGYKYDYISEEIVG